MRRRAPLAGALTGAAALLVAAGWAWAQEAPSPTTPAPPPPDAVASPSPPAPQIAPADTPPDEAAPAPEPKAAASQPLNTEAEGAGAPAEPPPPLRRPRFAVAIMQAADKITAETIRFEAKVGEPVRYRGVVLTVRACETTADDEPVFNSFADVDVISRPHGAAGRPVVAARQAFRGWMFANSPSLHPFEHPVYDLWLIACKTPAPVSAAPAA